MDELKNREINIKVLYELKIVLEMFRVLNPMWWNYQVLEILMLVLSLLSLFSSVLEDIIA